MGENLDSRQLGAVPSEKNFGIRGLERKTVFCVLLFALGCTSTSSRVDRLKESTSQNYQYDAEYAPLVEGILSAWNQSDLVCLGEGHGSKLDS